MDNHPIPQDVTGFQFKLIGNMTVKQFAYLATGGVFAVILYYAPVFILLKIVFIPLFAGSGAALAFLPIDGRPLDVMVTQLIKALVSPNQYVYKKVGTHFAFTDFSMSTHVNQAASQQPEKKKQEAEKQKAFVSYLSKTAPTEQKSAMDQRESAFLQHLFNPQAPLPVQLRPTQVAAAPTPAPMPDVMPPVTKQITAEPESLEEKDKEIIDTVTKMQAELNKAKDEEAHAAATQTQAAHDHTMSLEHQLQELLKQKEQLEQELRKMQQANAAAAAPQAGGTYTVEELKPEEPNATPMDRAAEPHVKKLMTQQEARSRGILSPSDSPNVLLGVVHDPRGNILSNILVELTDKEGTPVRAFKTNELGQFASATALPNGVFLLTLEDPKNVARFDTIEVITNGSILPPLDIVSHDEREELRKALFS